MRPCRECRLLPDPGAAQSWERGQSPPLCSPQPQPCSSSSCTITAPKSSHCWQLFSSACREIWFSHGIYPSKIPFHSAKIPRRSGFPVPGCLSWAGSGCRAVLLSGSFSLSSEGAFWLQGKVTSQSKPQLLGEGCAGQGCQRAGKCSLLTDTSAAQLPLNPWENSDLTGQKQNVEKKKPKIESSSNIKHTFKSSGSSSTSSSTAPTSGLGILDLLV